MQTLTKIQDIRTQISDWKKQGLTVGFVPTMGALHVGHAGLIQKSAETCDRTVVSIFVNPTQFGPNEDYSRYPRTLDSDGKICEEYGADLIFAPQVDEMYVQGKLDMATTVVPPADFTDKLCGKSRTGHFDGVATVVVKLLNIVQSDFAFFGQKDAQQLAVIKKFCLDLNLPVQIIGCPIVREADGLAYSSRNTYLDGESRAKALSLYQVIKKVDELYQNGNNDINTVFSKALELLHPDFELDYLDAVDSDTMQYVSELRANTLVAIAAKIHGVRLIDNLVLR